MGLSIIINHQDQNLTELSENLKNIFKSDFILKDDIESTIELIRLLPNLQMVIISHPLSSSLNFKKVVSFLEQEKKEIPVVVIGKGSISEFNNPLQEVLVIPHPKESDLIIETVANILGISVKKIKSSQEKKSTGKNKIISHEYTPISLNFLMTNNYSFFDVYRKEIVGESNIYQKIELPLESRTEILNSLSEQGVQELFVTEKDYDKILATKGTLPDIEDTSHNTFDEEKDLVGLGIKKQKREEILAGLKKIGISPHTFDMANEHIEKLFNRVEGFFSLESYLKKMFKDPSSFLYRKCHLTSYLGCQLLHNLQTDDLEESIPKWVFVSFFNDVPLVRKEELIIRSEVDLMGAKLDQKERFNVRRHPQLSAKALDECPNTPHGASTMILQHHGNNLGEGFPRFPHSTISPHAALFMTVEEFVISYLHRKWSIPEILEHIKSRFKYQKFKAPIEALEMTCHEHMRRSNPS